MIGQEAFLQIVTRTYLMSDVHALINPSYCLDSRDVIDLLSEFGPYEGRYVYQFPDDWLHRLEMHIEQLEPVERLKIKELIRSRMDDSLYKVKASYAETEPWEINVRSNKRFTNVPIVVGDAIDPMGFKTWIEALPLIHGTRQRSWHIGGSWSDYLKAIEPLLLKAQACYLVDRHFNPLSIESSDLLLALLERVQRSSCYKVHVITRYKAITEKSITNEMRVDVDSQIRHVYSSRIPAGRELLFHFVKEDKEGGSALRMHNRYFLTNNGAIDFGIGFKVLSQAHKQIAVHIVDKPLHQDLKAYFIDGVTRFSEKLPVKASAIRPISVDTISLQYF